MKLYFATSNAGKVDDVRRILRGSDIAVEQLDVELQEPSDADLPEIARAKVKQAWERSNVRNDYIMADDSGLFVQALNGFPGPHSAFFDARVGKEKLLRLLDPDDSDAAAFRAAIACYDPHDTHVETFTGRCDGRLVAPRGDQGFGYDPMFLPDGHDRTFAEDPAHKQQVSHRKQAMQQLKQWLQRSTRPDTEQDQEMAVEQTVHGPHAAD